MQGGGGRGQTLVIFALVLALFFTGMFALVADLSAVFIIYDRVGDGALLAAQAGASAVAPGPFYEGEVQLDPALAAARCQATLRSLDLAGTCSADRATVVATARTTVQLPVPLPGLTAPVSVIRAAHPVFGGALPEVTG
jgi:hypothetical protein